MVICKALKQMCIARGCFQTAQRVNKPSPGRVPHEVTALCQMNFFPSLKLSAAVPAIRVRVSYHEYVCFSAQWSASIRRR